MAKVGNEAKLILSLAKERVNDFLLKLSIMEVGEDYSKGYRRAVDFYEHQLSNIVRELELK